MRIDARQQHCEGEVSVPSQFGIVNARHRIGMLVMFGGLSSGHQRLCRPTADQFVRVPEPSAMGKNSTKKRAGDAKLELEIILVSRW